MKYTFKEQEVTVKGEYDLAATLTVPEGVTGKMPAIVIVCGTGKGDRDGNLKPRLNLNIYKMISDFLAGLGFVTIRYDKRGVAKSKGDPYKAGMNDLINDIISNAEYLKSLSYVDTEKIVLLGHSEGCILTTVTNSRYPVGGLILVAGAGMSMKTPLYYQNLAVYEEIQHKKGLMGVIMRKLITKEKIMTKVNKLLDTVQSSTKDVIRIQMMKFPAKWLREHLAYSDEQIIKLLADSKCPVLALTGDKDVQANPEDLKAIAELDKPHITCNVIPNMDHMLREYTGEKSVLNIKKQYMSEIGKPLNKDFLDQIEKWTARYLA